MFMNHSNSHSFFRTSLLWISFIWTFSLCEQVESASHTVKKGETLSEIAAQYQLSTKDLSEANGIQDPRQLQIGQILQLPNPDEPIVYIVRTGDSLGRIARKHQTTVQKLMDLNPMKNPDRLTPGQSLKLPPPESTNGPAIRNHPVLPASLRSEMNRIRLRSGWRYIVIHHSGTAQGSVKGMDRYHRDVRHMQNGLAYHFVIGNGKGMKNGEVAIGNRWKRQLQGGHLASEPLNRIAIGICLVGNFETSSPSAAQLKSLEALLAELLNETGLPPSAIRTHRQINPRPTRCPGRRFPVALINEWFS